MDVVWALLLGENLIDSGGGLGEGGQKIHLHREAGNHLDSLLRGFKVIWEPFGASVHCAATVDAVTFCS
jgi:hypothetical protein